jgi:hypothetical protein
VSSSPVNMALYRLLLKVGADEPEAEQAARLEASDLVTKADLLELKADLFKHSTQTLVWTTAIYAGITMIALTILRFT